MWVCQLCKAEYEKQKSRSIVCPGCYEKALTWPPQSLTPAQRLFGKCYEKEGHWEYGSQGPDGRPLKLMLDGRQKPAAQVALFVAGQPQPSGDHIARPVCGNKACVRPDHLGWFRWVARGVRWAHGLEVEDLSDMLATSRLNRARYQRDYRARLKSLGVSSMTELAARDLVAAGVQKANTPEYVAQVEGYADKDAARMVAAGPPQVGEPQSEAMPAPVVIEARAVKPAPALGLLASLAGAKIADPD